MTTEVTGTEKKGFKSFCKFSILVYVMSIFFDLIQIGCSLYLIIPSSTLHGIPVSVSVVGAIAVIIHLIGLSFQCKPESTYGQKLLLGVLLICFEYPVAAGFVVIACGALGEIALLIMLC
ncbi:unnamed protein product [Rodentolepis nana]|uniref:Sulfate_transp domain-containing protein n=1 Tax=Rodentolepis nana TaxID=102285 RepID=A0A0R3TR31_RODNA|nr:unnamed protein product [Rodentolepis nana]